MLVCHTKATSKVLGTAMSVIVMFAVAFLCISAFVDASDTGGSMQEKASKRLAGLGEELETGELHDEILQRRQGQGNAASSKSQATVTVASTDTVSEVTVNSATLPTPITSTPNTKPVALYVPAYDPLVTPMPYNVQYLGPGNGHSTVYEVVYSGNANRDPVTATLVEDATNARLVGAQQATFIDGVSTNVWAAVSCGFQDGLKPTAVNKAAGYCIYYNNANHVSSTWTTAITQIQPQITITPSPGAVQSSIASVASVHGQASGKQSAAHRYSHACSAHFIFPIVAGTAYLLF